MKILADASILGLEEAFPPPFIVTKYYHLNEVEALLKHQDILLCRSTLTVNEALLKHHPIKIVATASSGTDHIDFDYLNSQQIALIDAKGSNAESVADYVMSSLAYLEVNQLLTGNQMGIIGMGHVGSLVQLNLQTLGFKPLLFDPPKAERQADFKSSLIEGLYQCDVLCIHANLHTNPPHPTFNFINKSFLAKLKPGCTLINAARGGIVDEEALLNHQAPLIYCTDVYIDEPRVDKRIINKATLCTPHIAGHSLEAKARAIELLSEQLHRKLKLPLSGKSHPLKQASHPFLSQTSWKEDVLSFYNPIRETRFLKEADDKTAAFLSLRKNHHRHNFSVYMDNY